jgi:cephalosporin-C deacetylase-like acetyl esterase
MAAPDLSFTNARDQRLYASCVLPKRVKDIKAAMVFCHGYAEHSHRKMPGNLSCQQRMASSSDVCLL